MGALWPAETNRLLIGVLKILWRQEMNAIS